MSVQSRSLHIASSIARALHLWPFIRRTGIFSYVRRKRYPDTIVHLDVVVTECCTLRCRDCTNLMQYYHDPANLDPKEVISSLRRLLAAVRVEQLKILGGEPLVCQSGLTLLLGYLGREAGERVSHTEILTNGTLLPSEECLDAMKNVPGLKVVFSNYGELSSKQEAFSELCRREGIGYEILDDSPWWDFGDLSDRGGNERSVQHRFDGCYSRRLCTTLYRGKLYVCPRQAHAVRLGILPEDGTEAVDLSDPAYEDPAVLRDAVYRLIDRKRYISACRHCGCDKRTEVPRAVQAERPLHVS